jgi:cell wall-associated NlpC family hydrolase
MSFSDAIGQIDQIVQWEQQLVDPAALNQTTSTGGTTATDDTGSTSGTDPSTSASFAQTLAQAQAQDATTAATAADPTAAASALDPTAATSTDAALGTAGSSSLLGDGDSQLMASLSGLSSSSADEAAGATDPTSATDPTDEASALESALATTGTAGTTGTTGVTTSPVLVEGESGASGGTATSSADPRIQAMTEEANALVGKPYVWGGGHEGWGPQTGYDCSGFVSAVVHAGGYLNTPQDTTTLPSSPDMESGPGQFVTIYDRDKPGQQGHVIINIDGQFYESGGESGSWGGGGGVEQIATPTAKYLSTFDTILHPAGL